MNAYATKLAEGFSQKVIKILYENAPIDSIVNRDYEGEINAVGSKLNILTLQKVLEQDYTGANLSPSTLGESNAILSIEKKKAFYWTVKTIDKFNSYIKDPKSIVNAQTFQERLKNIMLYLTGFYSKAAAGNWYGVDYTTGTVTIDVAGNVTGSGTTFTSAMVGKPFKATGHTSWYRVKTFSSTTAIVIENDSDDNTSSYDGGVITAATYTIQANTVQTIDNSSVKFLDMVLLLKQRLDEAEVPDNDRWLLVPPAGETSMLKDPGIKMNVPAAYESLVIQGFLTELAGFKVFKLNRLQGDNTNGYHVMAGQSNFLTFADKALEVGIEEDLIGNFGAAFKDLFVYGGKVADERRKFGAHAFVKFS